MQTRNHIKNELGSTDVVILCGGAGTRLANVVADRPKPMAEVNEKPFLDILIDYFACFGLKRFILCAGHMSQVIKDHYAKKAGPLQFIISEEKTPLGTAGTIKNAQKFIKTDTFLVANGDSFCPVDLEEFHRFHFQKNALMSMVVTQSKDTFDCGSVVLDSGQKIVDFKEKKPGAGFVNAGIYFFGKNILNLIAENTKCSLEYDIFPKLTDRNAYSFICRKELIDIGTPQRYELAKKYFAQKADIIPVKTAASRKFTPQQPILNDKQ